MKGFPATLQKNPEAPSEENIQHFKTRTFFTFLFFWVILSFSCPRIQIHNLVPDPETQLNPDLD